jgi:hypothetical protein
MALKVPFLIPMKMWRVLWGNVEIKNILLQVADLYKEFLWWRELNPI